MKIEHKVSVILPVYNAEKCIEKAIISLLEQSYSNLEIIVVDDGSRDNSYALCMALAKNDDRIKVYSQKNTGVSGARNKGLSVMTGELVAFVDSDDWIPQDGIASLVQLYEKYHCPLICGSYDLIKTRDRVLPKVYVDELVDLKDIGSAEESLVLSLHCAPWAKVYVAEIIRKHSICFPIGIPYAEDGIFLFEYLKHINSLYITSQFVYHYNYTDCHSAARKYHVQYSHYLRLLLDAQRDFFDSRHYSGTLVNRLEHEYFERSLRHYILHENDRGHLESRIKMAASAFPSAAKNSFWGQYIQNDQLRRLIWMWKFRNIKGYCTEMIKMKICET